MTPEEQIERTRKDVKRIVQGIVDYNPLWVVEMIVEELQQQVIAKSEKNHERKTQE